MHTLLFCAAILVPGGCWTQLVQYLPAIWHCNTGEYCCSNSPFIQYGHEDTMPGYNGSLQIFQEVIGLKLGNWEWNHERGNFQATSPPESRVTGLTCELPEHEAGEGEVRKKSQPKHSSLSLARRCKWMKDPLFAETHSSLLLMACSAESAECECIFFKVYS